MIIGLTGSMGAGKGEVVKILEKEGFQYITLSMMVREEARKRGVPEEREQLMEVGNDLRETEGLGVLAKRALEKIQASGTDKWVVDGIRNPAEIDELKKHDGVIIVGLEANRDLLVERILKRARPSDAKTPDEILRKIERELSEGESLAGQQVGKCMQKTDVTLVNEGTLEELEKTVLNYYRDWQGD
ncbi:AAA family ATPase [Candidatus Peregrinibacteria bacterium]|nr:MAG: AAA family ATPase [Candidatus Peregrinibacteria bacterium]